jgi:hypothetical protein
MHGWLSLPTVTDPLHFCNKTAATAHPISIIRRSACTARNRSRSKNLSEREVKKVKSKQQSGWPRKEGKVRAVHSWAPGIILSFPFFTQLFWHKDFTSFSSNFA